MGLTNFPNGVTSFGIPMIQAPQMWLPKNATVSFVSAYDGSDTSRDGAYDRPYKTIQHGVSKQKTGGGTVSTANGSMLMVNVGTYSEQVSIGDVRGLKLIGSGIGISNLNLTGVTGTNVGGLTGGQAAGAPIMVLASRGCTVTGFTFKVVLNTYGLYLGDGTKFNSAWNYASQDNQVYGNLFDGDSWAGLYGTIVDGQKNSTIFNNYFFRLGGGGVFVDSGTNMTTADCVFTQNYIKATRGYGVYIPAGGVVTNWCTGPLNVFEDDPTTALTNPVKYAAASGKNAYVGNFQACANDFSMLSTDYQSGNFKATAGNTINYVSVA